MEDLCNLLFEVSNEDRLRILLQLDKEALNATNLSKELDLTIQESSRHLSRLSRVKLIQKDVEGARARVSS
jgi:DNA-binding transcriptional ArsR family regulator